ncbi:hypothetical protein NIES2101_32335 [Calothrix sp. HK-06]|nr:hypothetical protein NIES2101_32335 [Calothrix sp. HK-06]
MIPNSSFDQKKALQSFKQVKKTLQTLAKFKITKEACLISKSLLSHFCISCLLTITPSQAQVIPDATLPNATVVTQSDNTAIITGGTQAGNNLFHSFSQFSVPTGNTASFQHDVGIANIISRVTGTFPSNINGLIEVLQADGAASSANFFLINPNGILFGKDASLNIGGSFLASTAGSLKFADGSEFSAINPTNIQPLLTITVPIGLQFGENPNRIVNESLFTDANGVLQGLAVKPGKTLALVGGNVELSGGYLTAFDGRIELGSVASPGLMSLNLTDVGFILGYVGVQKFGDIQLSQASLVDVSGDSSGDVVINTRNLRLEGGSQIGAMIYGRGKGGNIVANAKETIELIGTDANGVYSGLFSEPTQYATGEGTNLVISANKVFIRDGALLNSTNFGSGVGGDVIVTAKLIESTGINIISIKEPSGIFATTQGIGTAGDITISTQFLSLQSGAQVSSSTLGLGQGGNITVSAINFLTVKGVPNSDTDKSSGIFAQTSGQEASGHIKIKTGELSLLDGGQIASITFADGSAGEIFVEADRIELAGVGLTTQGEVVSTPENPVKASGLLASSDRNSSGNGASLTIKTNTLNMRDGAIIQTSTLGSGDAGNLSITAKDISLNGVSKNGSFPTAILSASGGVTGGNFVGFPEATGKGGTVSVTTDNLTVQDNAQVAASSLNSTTAAQGAGNLDITARNIILKNGGKINTQSNSGDGGNIVLNIQDLLLLRNNSLISAAAGNAEQGGNGGNININAKNGFIIAALGENSDFTANAYTGKGGAINIQAQSIFGIKPRMAIVGNTTNDIDASSKFGTSGSIAISTLVDDPSSSLVELPSGVVDASRQITSSCNPGVRARGNSFTVTGRSGTAPTPTETLQAEVQTGRWITLNTEHPAISSSYTPTHSYTPVIEAQSWVKDKNGDVILVAQAPVQRVTLASRNLCRVRN